jgi:hypothetical protein
MRTNNEEGMKYLADREEEEREEELKDLQRVLSTDYGRRFIWRMINQCGMFRSSFTGNSQTFMMEGERNIALWLTAECGEADPENYMAMQQEDFTRRKEIADAMRILEGRENDRDD